MSLILAPTGPTGPTGPSGPPGGGSGTFVSSIAVAGSGLSISGSSGDVTITGAMPALVGIVQTAVTFVGGQTIDIGAGGNVIALANFSANFYFGTLGSASPFADAGGGLSDWTLSTMPSGTVIPAGCPVYSIASPILAGGGGLSSTVTTAFTVPTVGNTQLIDVTDAIGFLYEGLVTIKVAGSTTTYGAFYISSTNNSTSFTISNDARWSTNAGGDTIPVGALIVLVDFHPISPTNFPLGGFIETPTNKAYNVILSSTGAFTIRAFAASTLSGTLTAQLQQNGTPIGAGISVTSTLTYESGGPFYVAPGDLIQLVVTGVSSPVDLSYIIDLVPGNIAGSVAF